MDEITNNSDLNTLTPNNHIIRFEGAYADFCEVFENLLQTIKPTVPFLIQTTKEGKVYSISFQSTEQYEAFKDLVIFKAPFLQSVFN